MLKRSWVRIPDGYFFALICCKSCIVCLKKTEINEKEAGDGPFKKIQSVTLASYEADLIKSMQKDY